MKTEPEFGWGFFPRPLSLLGEYLHGNGRSRDPQRITPETPPPCTNPATQPGGVAEATTPLLPPHPWILARLHVQVMQDASSSFVPTPHLALSAIPLPPHSSLFAQDSARSPWPVIRSCKTLCSLIPSPDLGSFRLN